jgi:hypothetical protein
VLRRGKGKKVTQCESGRGENAKRAEKGEKGKK